MRRPEFTLITREADTVVNKVDVGLQLVRRLERLSLVVFVRGTLRTDEDVRVHSFHVGFQVVLSAAAVFTFLTEKCRGLVVVNLVVFLPMLSKLGFQRSGKPAGVAFVAFSFVVGRHVALQPVLRGKCIITMIAFIFRG